MCSIKERKEIFIDSLNNEFEINEIKDPHEKVQILRERIMSEVQFKHIVKDIVNMIQWREKIYKNGIDLIHHGIDNIVEDMVSLLEQNMYDENAYIYKWFFKDNCGRSIADTDTSISFLWSALFFSLTSSLF